MQLMCKILPGAGMILFVISGSCLDSDGSFWIIAALMALIGLALMYTGWRWERAKKDKKRLTINHRNSNPGSGYLDIDYPDCISKLK